MTRMRRRPLWATALVVAALLGGSLAGAAQLLAHPGPTAAPSTGTAPLSPFAAPSTSPSLGRAGVADLAPAQSTLSPVTPSGPGTFFQNSLIPNPSAPVCLSAYQCFNNTDEPSLNLTTNGYLVVAYTAYTNSSPCAAESSSTSTMVGFSRSTNLGSSWSTPTYWADPKCSGTDANYPDAAQPSLTSLANGTLVMAYEQFNFTSPSFEGAPQFYCYELSYDRIVVTESYDNGTSWTTPTELDSLVTGSLSSVCPAGYPDLQPSVAAIGQTVYVAWTNYTSYYFCGYSSEIDLRASTNGGSTWSAATQVPTVAGSWPGCTPSTYNAAASPALTVAPDGTLLVAYFTGLGLVSGPACSNCYEGGQVELASSTTNGSSFALSVVGTGVISSQYNLCCANSVFWITQPSIVYGATYGQIYVAWASMGFGDFCEIYQSTNACYSGEEVSMVTVANSSTGGATFDDHQIVQPLFNPNGGPYDQAFNPSIGVTQNGVLHLQASFENDSICSPGAFGAACGAEQQIYLNSTDNGTTWSVPVVVYYNYTGCGYPFIEECSWSGQYSTIVTIGNTVLLAWTYTGCDVLSTGECEYYYQPGPTDVAISRLFTGTGVTVTFAETGLPATVGWSVNMMGNYRAGPAGTNLVVSGVPASELEAYSIPWVNYSWGVAYGDTVTPVTPASFSTSGTVTATFTEYVLYQVGAVPQLPSYYWSGFGYSNYAISPTPGSYWIVPNSTQSETITSTIATFCYPCMNLTFQGWGGNGPGSVTTNSPNITVTPSGPVNETAAFVLNGFCQYNYLTATTVCLNNTYYPMTFQETGLPAGTTWGATVTYANGTIVTNSSTGTTDGFLVPESPVNFTLWTVPDPTSGDVWVPTTDVESPTEPPQSALIPVSYEREPASSASFSDTFSETGLPAGTQWSVTVGGQSLGVTQTNLTVTLAGGGPISVNGSAVYTESGTGYYASSVTVQPYVVNETTATWATPAAVTFNGSALVTVNYKPMYLLTTVAGPGGSVTPATNWFPGSSSIQLNAVPATGYHFVAWSGSGPGATTTTQDSQTNPVITPTGPVSELATFRANALPTWNLTVTPTGLVTGATFTVTIGGSSYTQAGPFQVGNLSSGNYTVSVPDAYLNSSQTTRFVPSSVVSDLTFSSPGTLEIDQNGSLTVAFSTEYELSLALTPLAGGTIAPAAGAYWEPSGSSVPITASPATGYVFIGWNATSPVGVVTAAASTTVTMAGPVTETAQFGIPPPPVIHTYGLTVFEHGLPPGLSWNLSVGTTGATGTSTSLLVSGLNGTYVVTIPDVYAGLGVRYVANELASNTTTITGNESLNVTFETQYLLTISATYGGSASSPGGATPDWVASGSSVTLSETPANASYVFVNWTGSGSGAYSGTDASPMITVNAPVTELATFAPHLAPRQATTAPASETQGLEVALGLLVALLVVGLVVGALVRRGRSPPAAGEDDVT